MSTPHTLINKLRDATTLEELFDYAEAPSTSPTLLARHIASRFDELAAKLSPQQTDLLDALTLHRQHALDALEAGQLGQGVPLSSSLATPLEAGSSLTIDGRTFTITQITLTTPHLTHALGVRDDTLSEVAIKVARSTRDAHLITRSSQALTRLFSDDAAQHKHLPRHLAHGTTREHGLLALITEPIDAPTLDALLHAHPTLAHPEHMVWILRRALSAIGWAHKQGIVHGHISPHTLRLRASDHNLWIDDWEYSCTDPATSGEQFIHTDALFSPPEVHARLAPLPSSDLYALGRTLQWLLRGGHPTGDLPEDTPEELVRLLRFMTLESPTGRARDAWELYHEVERIRRHLYGSHHFKTLL